MLFDGPAGVSRVTLILDSALHKDPQMSHHIPPGSHLTAPPEEMPRRFTVEVLVDGRWQVLREVADNHQRLVRLPVGRTVEGVRYSLQATWGKCEATNLYALYVD